MNPRQLRLRYYWISSQNALVFRDFLKQLFPRSKSESKPSWLGSCVALLFLSLTIALGGCASGSSANQNQSSPPVLPSSATLPASCTSATVGSSYNCQIPVSGGKAPFTWSVTGLPKGLTSSVSADTTTLTISGTPQPQGVSASAHTSVRPAVSLNTATTVTTQITVTDANGNTSSLSLGISVTSSALAITTASPLPSGTAGAAYSGSVTATGGTAPYTWMITGLPAGLTFTSATPSASISGTTNNVGTFSAMVTVKDSAATQATASATLSLTISQAATLMISTTTLPNGTVNTAYAQTLSATGGVSAYNWSVASGTLPVGLSLSAAGVISGTPTATGASSFTVMVADAESPAQSATQALSITINTPTTGLSITTASPLQSASLNNAYTTTVTATGGTPPYTWSLGNGSALPAGLSLGSASPSATISGTPTATGTFQFTLDVQDSAATPATASASFLLTVNGSSTLNCPATISLTLCGTYALGLRGFSSAGGATAFGIVIVADNAGHVISGKGGSNDSAGGALSQTFTGGSYAMDPSVDGRGVVTLIRSDASVTAFRFVLESAANPGPGSIEEFDNTGTLASGVLLGPLTLPFPQFSPHTILSLALEGVNTLGNRTGLLAEVEVGANGCDGTQGSLSSVTGEPAVVNTAGTVNAALTLTGACLQADPNTGIGAAQVTISGGTPFSNTTLNFTYIVISSGTTAVGALMLETDAIGASQPILSGVATGIVPPAGGFNAASLGCPCLLVSQGTTTGSVSTGNAVASITRITGTPGTGASGTASGVFDENSGGTVTLGGTWPYNAYSIDANGVGTITGTGPTLHFLVTGTNSNGNTISTLDESAEVLVGAFRPQNATSIMSPGAPYILGRDLGVLGITQATQHVVGVITPTGASSGSVSGIVDIVSASGSMAAAAATGSYTAMDPSTGRGTGTMNLTGATSSISVVIYARRGRQFVVLDIQSANPYIIGANLQ